jgi:uncharacterized protein (DUF2267 family)
VSPVLARQGRARSGRTYRIEEKESAMSATGLDVFDKSLQTTNIWLKELTECEGIGPDRQVAWRVLGAVLHTLRDRLGVEQAAHFGAELPLIVRGLYYDRWHPAGKPDRERRAEEFCVRVASELSNIRPVNAEKAARAVFTVISLHVSAGQVEKIRQSLPEDIRRLWPERTATPMPRTSITEPPTETEFVIADLEKTGAA